MEKTKNAELLRQTNLVVKEKKGITINEQPLEMYDREDLKYVERKIRKAINVKKKRFNVDNFIFFTRFVAIIVNSVDDLLDKIEKE